MFLTARFQSQAKLPLLPEGFAGTWPSDSLTHRLDGKTVTQLIPTAPSVERTKARLAQYRRFRHSVRELIAVRGQICHNYRMEP